MTYYEIFKEECVYYNLNFSVIIKYIFYNIILYMTYNYNNFTNFILIYIYIYICIIY